MQVNLALLLQLIVGTVRIEKRNRDNIDNLTFNEIANIVEGQILGGKKGLGKLYPNLR